MHQNLGVSVLLHQTNILSNKTVHIPIEKPLLLEVYEEVFLHISSLNSFAKKSLNYSPRWLLRLKFNTMIGSSCKYILHAYKVSFALSKMVQICQTNCSMQHTWKYFSWPLILTTQSQVWHRVNKYLRK